VVEKGKKSSGPESAGHCRERLVQPRDIDSAKRRDGMAVLAVGQHDLLSWTSEA